MSLDAMDWVWKYSQAKGVGRLVMLAIADKAPGHACKAFASMTLLQQLANAGRSTVIGVIRELAASGELEIVEGESGPNGAAMYRLPKALGHVRSTAGGRHKSVQKLHRSGSGANAGIGAEAGLGDDESGDETGAETAPAEDPGAARGDAETGAETEPIGQPPLFEIGAVSAPIQGGAGNQIGADSGQQSVQILDGIGADSAPHNHEQLLNQTTNTSSADAVDKKSKAKSPSETKGDPPPAADIPRFDEFYRAYPVHKDKTPAQWAYAKAIARGVDPQHMIDIAARYAAECKASGTTYIKYPATWLNKGSYDDDAAPTRTANGYIPPPVNQSDEDYNDLTWN